MNQENQPQISRRALMGGAALGAAAIGASVLPALAQDAPAAAPAAPPAAPPAPVAPAAPPAPETPVTVVDSAPVSPPSTLSASDLEIANFALGLERLEAAFYAQVRGAQQARPYISGRVLEAVTEIGAIEISHAMALETAIIAAGGTPAPMGTYKFPGNVFISVVALTWFAHTLEEIGIGAYLGAIGQIQDQGLRRAAASIYGAETRHAAIMRSLGGFTFAPNYFESPLSVAQVQELIAPYVS